MLWKDQNRATDDQNSELHSSNSLFSYATPNHFGILSIVLSRQFAIPEIAPSAL